MKRDVKGLYSRALKGIIKTLPGLQVPYEEPVNPEVIVDTSRLSVRECVDEVVRCLEKMGYI